MSFIVNWAVIWLKFRFDFCLLVNDVTRELCGSFYCAKSVVAISGRVDNRLVTSFDFELILFFSAFAWSQFIDIGFFSVNFSISTVPELIDPSIFCLTIKGFIISLAVYKSLNKSWSYIIIPLVQWPCSFSRGAISPSQLSTHHEIHLGGSPSYISIL